KLINFTEQYQNGMTGFKRFIEIMEQDHQKEAKNPIELENVKGVITYSKYNSYVSKYSNYI
ncbi:hypothetical protein ACTPEF_25785, partial [Clostridioides difficile]